MAETLTSRFTRIPTTPRCAGGLVRIPRHRDQRPMCLALGIPLPGRSGSPRHGEKVLGSVILSRTPLVAVGPRGMVKPAHFEELNRRWKAGYLNQEAILPAV